MNNQTHLTLSALQATIKRGIDQAHPLPYWVSAEVSELKVNYSGHCYLELVEKGGANHVPQAKVSAVIWRTTFQKLDSYFLSTTSQKLASGMSVLVKVVISYHPLYGLSLQITDIDPNYTLGDMARQRQQTIRLLQEDGVYEMNREMELPVLIQRLAVISSRNAAGYQDFMQELSRSSYRFEVDLFDAFMQGAEAENSILEALDRIGQQYENYDALVVIRGGGSQSDLGCFDSYRLCCHLAQFPLPILTGIGHDKDESVADLVAAIPLKTPTAVAVYIHQQAEEFDRELGAMQESLMVQLRQLLSGENERLQTLAFRLQALSKEGLHQGELHLSALLHQLASTTESRTQRAEYQLSALQQQLLSSSKRNYQSQLLRLDRYGEQLSERTTLLLQGEGRKLEFLSELIATHDPQRILARGFARVSVDGKTLQNSREIAVGSALLIELQHGTIEAEVKGVGATPSPGKRATSKK